MVAFENILVPPRGSPLKTWSIKQSSPVVPSYTRLVSAPQSHLQCFLFYYFFGLYGLQNCYLNRCGCLRVNSAGLLLKKYGDKVLLLKKE